MPLIRQLAWTGLVLAAVLVFTATGTYDAMGTAQARIGNQLMAGLILGGWLVVALIRPAWRPRSPLMPFVALVAGAYALSAVTSQRPRLSLEPMLGGLALALAFAFLATLLGDPWFRRRMGALMVRGTVVVTGAYLTSVALEWAVFYNLSGQLGLPPLRPSWGDLNLGSPNVVATVLLVLGPLAVAILARVTGRLWPSFALAALGLVAIFITGSRGAYLGAGLALASGALLVALRSRTRPSARRLIGLVRDRPIVLAPAILAVLAGVVAAPLVALRFAQGGDSLRMDLWRSAFAILVQHPVLGGGPGTWVQLKVENAPPGVPNLILPHAHNLVVQAAAELGVVGLLALGLLAVAVLRRLLAGLVRGGPDIHAIAVIIGLVAFLGQSMVDNLVNLPCVTLLVIAIVAWVDGGLTAAGEARPNSADPLEGFGVGATDRDRSRLWPRERRRLAAALVALVALAASIPTVLRIDAAAAAQEPGNASLIRDPAKALEAYDRALALDPDFTLYSIQRAAALGRLGRLAEARDQLAEAVKLDSVGINLISLASLELALGDQGGAAGHIRLALERSPKDLTVTLNAGLFAARLGDPALALEQLSAAVALRPAIASLPLFDDPSGTFTKAEVIAKGRDLAGPLRGALILAYAGDPAAAETVVEAQPLSTDREIHLAAVQWLGGDATGAVARLETVMDANPLDYRAAGWLAAILRAERDSRADKYARLSQLIQGDAWPGVAHGVTARIASADEPWFGMPSNYPWAIYLRAYSDVLAPGLTLIGTRY